MLNRKNKYLQIAFNNDPWEAEQIIGNLPSSDRIILEAGTPLIKSYGINGIRRIFNAGSSLLQEGSAYVVADTKCMDRGKTEVLLAKEGGACAATVLGAAPIETINYFISACVEEGIDSMIDMIGVDQPIKILRKLKKSPTVVILHRGVDEEMFDKNKPIPYLQINKIRSSIDAFIAIAGGDTIREVQRVMFNDADIAVVWKDFYKSAVNSGELAREFLQEIK